MKKKTRQQDWQEEMRKQKPRPLCPHCGGLTSKKPDGSYYYVCDSRREWFARYRKKQKRAA